MVPRTSSAAIPEPVKATTDYFHEAFHKRLAAARPPLHVKLRYAPETMGPYFQQLTNESVVGSYQRSPVQNGWHSGRIELPR